MQKASLLLPLAAAALLLALLLPPTAAEDGAEAVAAAAAEPAHFWRGPKYCTWPPKRGGYKDATRHPCHASCKRASYYAKRCRQGAHAGSVLEGVRASCMHAHAATWGDSSLTPPPSLIKRRHLPGAAPARCQRALAGQLQGRRRQRRLYRLLHRPLFRLAHQHLPAKRSLVRARWPLPAPGQQRL